MFNIDYFNLIGAKPVPSIVGCSNLSTEDKDIFTEVAKLETTKEDAIQLFTVSKLLLVNRIGCEKLKTY